MPNTIFYIYIKTWSVNIFLITFLNEPELIFWNTVKWFQILISNMNNSIYYWSFVCMQLNGFNYCFVTATIKHLSLVFTQLNGQTLLFLKIQFNISHLLVHSLKCRTVLFDLSVITTPDQSGPDNNGNEVIFHIPRASPFDSLVSYQEIQWVGGSYPSAEIQSVYSTNPPEWDS